MERMGILDAGLFFDGGGNAPMHAGSVAVFDGPAPAYGDLVRLLLARLALVPRYRQRVRTVPLRLGRPVWVDDEHFQIRYHLRHAALPAPGGAEQVRDLAGRVFAQRLDVTRPLWEMWLVEGLGNGRWAIIGKTHLCMVDGPAGADLLSVLLDAGPDRRPPAPRSWIPAPTRSTAWHLVDGVRDTLVGPVHRLARDLPTLARGLPAVIRDPAGRSGAGDLGRHRGAGTLVTLHRLAAASARSLNGPLGPHRRWDWADAALADVTAIRSAFGGTVHATVLAAVTRGLHDLLAGRGGLSRDRVVRALVPVAVRARGDRAVPDFRSPPGTRPDLSGIGICPALVNLPAGEPDAVARLARIRGQLDEIVGGRPAIGAAALTGLAGFAAPTLVAMGARITPRFPQSMIQVVVTNAPGPGTARYLLGRPMVEIHPYVPVAGGVRISVGVASYLGRLHFGLTADFDSVPDLGVLRDGIRAGVDELTGRAGVIPPRCPDSPPRAPTGPD